MRKLIPLIVLLMLSTLKMVAQSHLKDVQVTSVWAPADVKVDGRINEWEDHFQAYNKSTRLFYTVSNNDKYLFLAITSTDASNNNKIVAGGITLTVNTAGKKKDKNAYSLTFPIVARGARGQRGQRGGGARGGRPQGAEMDTAAVSASRKQLITSSKEIKVIGFKDMTDSLISIYNEYGIKTAIGYDSLGNYSYELAIPLKLIELSIDQVQEIAYNIKVNGLANMGGGAPRGGAGGGFGAEGGGGGGFGGGGNRGGGGGRGNGGGSAGAGRGSGQDMADLTSPTDFWAKYTLAKK